MLWVYSDDRTRPTENGELTESHINLLFGRVYKSLSFSLDSKNKQLTCIELATKTSIQIIGDSTLTFRSIYLIYS
jgi:hypothetical protein